VITNRKRKPAKTATGRPPRQVALIADARIPALDDCAASISELREQINALRAQEAEALQRAMNLMRTHSKISWQAHGVELVRVPGEEKLRVRTSKEPATAAADR
jgi:hypothetical protein